jgi:hypothetical protein
MLGIFDLLSFNVPKLKDLKAVPGQKNGYKFSSKFQTYKKVPAAFLQLNQRELSAFYRSAALFSILEKRQEEKAQGKGLNPISLMQDKNIPSKKGLGKNLVC